MSLYFGATEITGLYFGDTEITGLYFGDTEIWTAWAEYDGTLPALYSANGSTLADYRVYGAVGGVGDVTENLFDPAAYTATGFYLTNLGGYYSGAAWRVSDYIPVVEGEEYLLTSIVGQYPSYCWYDADKEFISGVRYMATSGFVDRLLTAPQNAAFLRFSYVYDSASSSYNEDKCMVIEGSTAPASYAPYGYEVDMSVTDGTASTITPIYTGDPLEDDEYVSFKEQKVYRRTEQLFNAEATYKKNRYKDNDGVEKIYLDSGYYPAYIPITPGETINVINVAGSNDLTVRLYFYDAQKQWIQRTAGYISDFSVVAPNNAAFIQLQIPKAYIPSPNTITIIQGSTAPSTYIPYYDPQDPPISLPTLPTIDGINVVDYAGQSAAPSKFYAKYRKEGY